jgi:hypothetical protein
VTGTFDGWKKTEKLSKVGEHFEKHVQLSDASKKIYYKVCAHLFRSRTAHGIASSTSLSGFTQ